VIAKAETGTGKTLAFGAPMISKIDPARATVLGLVLCPTRELAQQVASVLEKLGAARAIRVALVVGGEEMHPQITALKGGAQVVVGTPGRVLDLYRQGFLSFPWTEFVVLDEADEMLEIGFIDDVRKILSLTPDERQTLHFSATFPHEVLALARESTKNPVEIATAAGVATVDTIEQSYVEVDERDRPRALRRLIEDSAESDVFLIFCGRRTEVDQLLRTIERSPIPVKALHGGYDQAARFRVMSAFREGTVKALLATDVASRGLDVHHVTHVINYSVPKDLESYTHRIGRTGRAGRTGKAITFVTPDKAHRWRAILRAAPWEVPRAEAADGRGARRDGGRRDGRRDSAERPRGRRRETREPEEPRGRSEGGRGSRRTERRDPGRGHSAGRTGERPAEHGRRGDRAGGGEEGARRARREHGSHGESTPAGERTHERARPPHRDRPHASGAQRPRGESQTGAERKRGHRRRDEGERAHGTRDTHDSHGTRGSAHRPARDHGRRRGHGPKGGDSAFGAGV
jgi:ATP-dependent RNA helicase DeaD